MNKIQKFTAVLSIAALSLTALPAFALYHGANVDANVDADVDVNVGVGASGGATTSSDSGSAGSQTSASGNTVAEIAPLIMTRADMDADVVAATSATPSGISTSADLSGFVAARMESDENIAAVETSVDDVSVTYKQRARLLGFIPITLRATATVHADGSVEISYPWYAFLSVTNEDELRSPLQERVGTTLGAKTAAGTSAKLAASEQAQLVADITAVMEAELNAAADASAAVR